MKLKNWFGLLSPKKGRNWNHENSAIDELIFDVLLSLPLLCFLVMLGASYCLVSRNGLARDFRPRNSLTIWLVVAQWHSHGIDGP